MLLQKQGMRLANSVRGGGIRAPIRGPPHPDKVSRIHITLLTGQ